MNQKAAFLLALAVTTGCALIIALSSPSASEDLESGQVFDEKPNDDWVDALVSKQPVEFRFRRRVRDDPDSSVAVGNLRFDSLGGLDAETRRLIEDRFLHARASSEV